MNCPNCGHEQFDPPQSEYCTNCGKPNGIKLAAAKWPDNGTKPKKEKQRKTFGLYLLIARYLAMAIIALLVGIVYWNDRPIMVALILLSAAMFFLAIQYYAVARLSIKEEASKNSSP